MIRTLDLVALLENLPESKLRRGDVGIVVTCHITAAQYDVEFGATTERAVTLVILREDQLLKLNQASEELSLYAPVAEHWKKVVERPSAESKSDGSSPPLSGRLLRITLSNHWCYGAERAGKRLPTFCVSSSRLAMGSLTRAGSPLDVRLGLASALPPSPGRGR
jgi:hypothetical protein